VCKCVFPVPISRFSDLLALSSLRTGPGQSLIRASAMKRKSDGDDENPRKKSRSLPKDVVHHCTGMPRLPDYGRLVGSVTSEDMLNGDVTRLVAWDPDKCAHAMREKVRAILDGSSCPGDLTEALCATWQYFAGGPAAVKNWEHLHESWKRLTRSELGFIQVDPAMVRTIVISASDEDSGDNDDDDEEDADDADSLE
jgi:hypothetical protein